MGLAHSRFIIATNNTESGHYWYMFTNLPSLTAVMFIIFDVQSSCATFQFH